MTSCPVCEGSKSVLVESTPAVQTFAACECVPIKPSAEVKRYRVNYREWHEPMAECDPRICVEMVKSSDYDAIRASLAQAESALARMRGTLLAINHNANRSMTDRQCKETLTNIFAMVDAALATTQGER